jgi:hypothetical protein
MRVMERDYPSPLEDVVRIVAVGPIGIRQVLPTPIAMQQARI